MKGRLFVISAPSGAGKTTLLKRVMAELPGLAFSVSHTTRQPRPGEKDGIDYHFISHDGFRRMIAAGEFLEFAEVHDNFYGTNRQSVMAQAKGGSDVILDIDVQGAEIIRNERIISAAHIFIAPPGLEELERRLRGRGTEDDSTVTLRMKNAEQEMTAASEYQYLMVNDDLGSAVNTLKSIIIAERAAAHRHPDGRGIELGLHL
ncbi:guanylate kinase [Desulforhopalus vacuolatus]|uniref:guanylate kinase n=1 Tax=Desulforhopalus vacuolatus TaxID=40414 RepID=UPI00196365D6|nr:guanylate kinase [Desulforhopalus vacuolatus]MBM9520141.1 guanylate kinase [Desulforhopalus vacuolatus]